MRWSLALALALVFSTSTAWAQHRHPRRGHGAVHAHADTAVMAEGHGHWCYTIDGGFQTDRSCVDVGASGTPLATESDPPGATDPTDTGRPPDDSVTEPRVTTLMEVPAESPGSPTPVRVVSAHGRHPGHPHRNHHRPR